MQVETNTFGNAHRYTGPVLRLAITPGLHPVNNDADATRRLLARCVQLAESGVDFILLREKHLPAEALTRLAATLARTLPAGCRLLVAATPEAVLAAGARGIHMPAHSLLTAAAVRRTLPEAYVTISCHTLADVRSAVDAGVSAILFAPVFGKVVDGVEVVAGGGLDRLHEACAAAGDVPVFALGGVTAENAAACIEAGAAGIASIRLFFPDHP